MVTDRFLIKVYHGLGCWISWLLTIFDSSIPLMFFYHEIQVLVSSVWMHVSRAQVLCKSRWLSWAPVPSKSTVSVDVKQSSIKKQHSANQCMFIVCRVTPTCWKCCRDNFHMTTDDICDQPVSQNGQRQGRSCFTTLCYVHNRTVSPWGTHVFY